MQPLCPSTVVWSLVAIQALGVVTAWFARVSEGTQRQLPVQVLFFVLLVLIALGTLLAVSIGRCHCLMSGATLATMVLTAVWDFSPNRQALV